MKKFVVCLVVMLMIIGCFVVIGCGVSDEQIKKEYIQFVKGLNRGYLDVSESLKMPMLYYFRHFSDAGGTTNESVLEPSIDKDYETNVKGVEPGFRSSAESAKSYIENYYDKVMEYKTGDEELNKAKSQTETLVSSLEEYINSIDAFIEACIAEAKGGPHTVAAEALSKRGDAAGKYKDTAESLENTLGIEIENFAP